jgi:hypothetical protein
VVTLANIGNQGISGVTTLLRSGHNLFQLTDSLAGYGSIPAGGNATNGADPFAVQVDPTIPLETPVPMTLFITGADYVDTLLFTITVGEIRQCDPIPDGPRVPPLYWAYDDADSAYNQHPQFNWIETRGRGTQITLSDDQTVTLDLPTGFAWQFYGQSYSQLSVCGNGFITPGATTNAGWTNSTLPSTSMPGLIAANWDDLYPPDGGGVWWFYDAANHAFVVEWDSVGYYPSGSGLYDKFEIVVFDTSCHTMSGDNVVVVQYLTANNYISNTVGIQDPTMTIGIQCLYDNAYHRGTTPLAAGRAIKFLAEAPSTGIAERSPVVKTSGLSLRAYPNPFHGSVCFSVELPSKGPITAGIYDQSGRLVRRLASGAPASRDFSRLWDGRDEQGIAVAPGIYFCRIAAAGAEAHAKIVLSR